MSKLIQFVHLHRIARYSVVAALTMTVGAGAVIGTRHIMQPNVADTSATTAASTARDELAGAGTPGNVSDTNTGRTETKKSTPSDASKKSVETSKSTESGGAKTSTSTKTGTTSPKAPSSTSTGGSSFPSVPSDGTTQQPAPAVTSSFCSTQAQLPSSKPTSSNTGVPAGKVLTNSGSLNITADGTVIDGLNITGKIVVTAKNVVIKNSRITTTDYFAVTLNGTNVSFINNEVRTTAGGYVGIIGGNAFICGNYVHGFENGMTMDDSNAIIQANYIDKLLANQAGPHYDGIEIYGGNNYKVYGNNILMTDQNGNWRTETGAINIAPYGGASVDNVELRGNWMGGGSYTLTLDNNNGVITRLYVYNNRWYGSGPTGYAGYGPIRAPGIMTAYSGNVWDTSGQPIP